MIALALTVAGCQHHLVAAPGESTVPIYTDRQTYDKVDELKRQKNPMGALARGLALYAAKKVVDDNTPVKILSSDDEGDTVEVTDGPAKGEIGFVPKSSVK